MIKAVIFDMYETLITLFDNPAYLSKQMAEDAGIRVEEFEHDWNRDEDDRILGNLTVEASLMEILEEHGCYTEEKLDGMLEKFIRNNNDIYDQMNSEIQPMMKSLKECGIKIGLITNCYHEEAMAIRDSVLYQYFDVACFSCDERIMKPDERIFVGCAKKLGVSLDECLYVGDGGSKELETAKKIGMNPVQAVWYLKEGTGQPSRRMHNFIMADNPMRIPEMVCEFNYFIQ